MESKSSKVNNGGGGGGGFKARMEHYIYSGEKKHVFAGMAIIGVIFGVPWYFMNRASSQDSHYLDWLYLKSEVQDESKVVTFRSPNEDVCTTKCGGTKHRSHQDYLEKADKARSARLSSSAPSTK